MISLKDIIRPSILKLKAYSSARSLTNKYSTPDSSTPTVYLDANESSMAPNLETNLDWESTLNRYPQPQPESLVQRFSEIYNVDTNKILITRGSDEAIDILTRAVCEPNKDSILIMPPTYGMYEVSADIQNVTTIEVPLILKSLAQTNKASNSKYNKNQFTKNSTDNINNIDCVTPDTTDNKTILTWEIDLASTQQIFKTEKNLKIAYICSPNNPTGTVFSKADIIEILKALPNQTLLVVDEAYCEFSPEGSVSDLLVKYPQLVVLRTLSKAWGLAGLRMGVLLGHPELISILQKVRAPYPLPTPVIQMAHTALSKKGYEEMQSRVKSSIQNREFLKSELQNLEDVVQIYPSETNFLLIEFKDVQKIMNAMLSENIILRDRSTQIPNTIRITVGSKAENELLISSLKKNNNLKEINMTDLISDKNRGLV
jgi:histidinol-phosphate aminotransferase